MLIIGLTGPSGAGKGAVASLFAKYGIPSIDTDAVYHRLLVPPSPCLDELTERFGCEILNTDGTLNRKALAARVFASGHEADLRDLNRITHRHVLERVRRLLDDYRTAESPAVLVDAPQLFESGFDAECDVILSVLASRESRLARIMKRDGLDEASALSRINAQRADDFFREHSHEIIINDGDVADLEKDVKHLLTKWEVRHEA